MILIYETQSFMLTRSLAKVIIASINTSLSVCMSLHIARAPAAVAAEAGSSERGGSARSGKEKVRRERFSPSLRPLTQPSNSESFTSQENKLKSSVRRKKSWALSSFFFSTQSRVSVAFKAANTLKCDWRRSEGELKSSSVQK